MSIFFNDYDDALLNLIEKGLIEIVGIDENGKLIYKVADNVEIKKDDTNN
jgi:hypothetical protein